MPAPQHVPATPSVPGHKHYLLYARQNLKDTRLLLGGIFVAYLGVGLGDVYTHNFDWRRFTPWALYSLFPIFVFIALWLYGRFTYSVVDDDGVGVRMAYRTVKVPYTEIEKARIDSIDRIFDRPERSRMRTRAVKNLGDTRALCIRIRDDDNLPAIIRRKLGPRMVLDRELVLPITETDNAFAAVRSRLGSRRASVVDNGDGGGGGRRRRRKKGRR
ncbi:MAG TPA: hypothetical protein VG329_09035 [Candidatus Dormibacteraeota bacterium]|nr:hypothetical protein [Candidatus Dormibacteraeota bacterium]